MGLLDTLFQQIGNLIQQFGNFALLDVRLFVTVFIVVSVGAVLVVAWFVHPRLQERMHHRLADVITLSGVCLYLFVAGMSLVFLWSIVNTDILIPSNWGKPTKIGINVVLTAATLAVAYVVVGISEQAIDRFAEQRDGLSQHQTQMMIRVAQVCVYVVALTVVLGFWGADFTGLLVGAGFLGIVVGMAARQTLGSLLAGFMLMFARPFEIGDWVEIEEQEGIVTDITIVNTRIQTFDGEYVMIPNDTVGGSTIVNRSRKGRLRLEVDVGVDYDADVERAAELAEDVMSEPDGVLGVPSPQVVTKELGDSAVVLGLRFWIDKPSARRKWRAKTKVINTVKAAFESEGIKIPYPQRELSGREETNGFQIAPEGRRTVEQSIEGGPTADGGEEPDGRIESDDERESDERPNDEREGDDS